MTGLRTKENDKFIIFFSYGQNEASKLGCTFFLDTGEGHFYSDDKMEGMDLSGWLIPNNLAQAFEKEYIQNINLDKWDEFYQFAEWKLNGTDISIYFVKY